MKTSNILESRAKNQLWIPRQVNQPGRTFGEREQQCQAAFLSGGPYFQLCMDSLPFDLFTCEADFKVGMNMLATSVVGLPVVVYNEILMNSHGHVILGGLEGFCRSVFHNFKQKMRRFDQSRGFRGRLDKWEASLWPITDLRQMRNEIVYVSRNAYVARHDATPTGYPWGSGDIFFNDNLRNYCSVPFDSLPYDLKREICRGHNVGMPANYRFGNGIILPISYVSKTGTEAFFNTASQYFSMLARHAEADVEIARKLHETVHAPDDEMFSLAYGWSQGQFGKGLRDLSDVQKAELAKKMKYSVSSTNEQIARVLGLRKAFVDSIFPVQR